MSENIFKKSSFKKNVSNNNNDKGKSVIKNNVDKHNILMYPSTGLFENILKLFF